MPYASWQYVADPRDPELHRRAPGRPDPTLDRFGNCPQVNMTGDNLVKGVLPPRLWARPAPRRCSPIALKKRPYAVRGLYPFSSPGPTIFIPSSLALLVFQYS